ncbi:MAG: MotA/TolQ/ExbB proton channel family protein [Gammaproteobacteria bacterium]|nr:MotA/TolQ/ExbB proton channel family protein [Gammaproteobacteria bacterium]
MKALAKFAINNSLIVDIFGLLISGVVVHLVYMFWIDPSASQLLYIAQEQGEPPPRTLAIILKDPEQEICVILGLWCAWLWLFRYQLFMDEPHLLKTDFLDLRNKTAFDDVVLTELRRNVTEKLRDAPHLKLLGVIETVLNTLEPHRPISQFKEASDIGAAACDVYLEQLDAKLSLNKYILWAIPSVGFLGTVRGIGEALGRADEALAGDITGVANSLGVAFNSTFCALFISLVLMLASYLLQGREERLVANYKHFIAADLIGKLTSLAKAQASPRPLAPDDESYG